jgi:hypothetical protein
MATAFCAARVPKRRLGPFATECIFIESRVADTQTDESVQVVEDINAKMGKTGDTSFVLRQREVFMGISEPEEDKLRRNGENYIKTNFANHLVLLEQMKHGG